MADGNTALLVTFQKRGRIASDGTLQQNLVQKNDWEVIFVFRQFVRNALRKSPGRTHRRIQETTRANETLNNKHSEMNSFGPTNKTR